MKTESVYRGDPKKRPISSVTVDGKRLKPCFRLKKHSTDGFAWGYGGSGPAQLALAIMVDFLGDDEEALRVYQSFKSEVVARLKQDEAWELTGKQIAEADCVKSLVASSVVEN